MERIILHIDVNNAFLSWSALDLLNQGYRYDIRESYAVIGGDEAQRRGVVLAKSMKAKKMGVVTGEPLFQARKKCPALKSYPANYPFYQQMSKQLFELLSNYTDDIEIFSIDECFLDYTKVQKLYGNPISFAMQLKERIKTTLGFTVNIGIANNKLCAKMASDFTKPDRVHTLFQNEIATKMWPLPVSSLFGIGKKSVPKLEQLQIYTIFDLAHTKPETLYPYFKNQSVRMIESANGVDISLIIREKGENKGISNSTTLASDVFQKEELYPILQALSENVSLLLRKQRKYALVVAVILKDKYFHSFSHQRKLVNATNMGNQIYQVCKDLLQEMWNGSPIRLVGVRLDQLVANSYHQVSLFEKLEEKEENENLDRVIDTLKEKYGMQVIQKASLNHTTVKRNGLEEGKKKDFI